jgi:hypothetical protein
MGHLRKLTYDVIFQCAEFLLRPRHTWAHRHEIAAEIPLHSNAMPSADLNLRMVFRECLGKNCNRMVERTGVWGGHSAAGSSGEKEVGETESKDDVFVV